MKSSYKVALLIAAGLLVIVLGYWVAQNGDAPPPGVTDVADPLAMNEPATNGEAAETGSAEDRGRIPAATTPPAPPADEAEADADADANANAAPPSGDPFLDSLRASIARANNGADQDAPAPDADAADAQMPPEQTPTGPGADALARANDSLGLTPSTEPTDPLTRAPLPGAARPVPPTPGVQPAPPAPAADAPTTGRAAPQPPEATPAAQPARPAAQPREYTIKPGDTFSRIAQQLYNDESRWVDIAQANPLVDPARLQVGQVIRLPGAPQAAAPRQDAAEAAGGASPRNGVPYTIRAHDTLSSIAQQHYNDPRLWNVIYNANRAIIGDNPDRIPAGREIIIPPAPNGAQ